MHAIMSDLTKKATADESDKAVKDPLWLLFGTSVLTTGFNLDEPTQIVGRIHRTIELGSRGRKVGLANIVSRFEVVDR